MIEGVNTFISTQAFHGEFYVYTANGPSGNKGYITLVPGATAEKCPAGRALHATGKKLTPGIHPMSFLLGKPLSNPRTLISVYDSISLLRGFIDPSSPTFTRPGMPQQIPSSAVTLDTSSSTPETQPVVSQVIHPVVDLSILNTAVDHAISQAVPQAVSDAVTHAMSTFIPAAVTPAKILVDTKVTFPAGDYSTIAAEAGSSSIGSISNIPGKLSMKVNTTALTDHSMVFLTPLGRGPTLVAISDVQPSIGQFTIAAGSVCTVNWLIVN